MIHPFAIAAIAGAVLTCGAAFGDIFPDLKETSASYKVDRTKIPRASEAPEISREKIIEMRDRAMAAMLSSQQPNGAWGSPKRTKGLNIAAPVPGAHYAFSCATTSLVVEGLIAVGGDSPEVHAALDRAEKYLLRQLHTLRRGRDITLYNIWGHSYGIKALVGLYKRAEGDAKRQTKIKIEIENQVDLLRRMESINQGWGYYEFEGTSQRPMSKPTSFTTATALIALKSAQSVGVEIPERLIITGLQSVERMRVPDGSYVYSLPLAIAPRITINRPGGSLARTPACNAALAIWQGDDTIVSEHEVVDWMDRFITREGWLAMALKKPIPHESHFKNSGYFYYYGVYYASLATEMLPDNRQEFFRAHMLSILLERQEKDGTWWDYPLYDYHKPYGTGYVLASLQFLAPYLKTDPESTVY